LCRHCATVRKVIITIFIVLLLWIGWSAWPLAGLNDFARAVRAGDNAGIEAQIDYPALGNSLKSQILETYVRLSGVPVDRGLMLGIASAVADPLIARLLSHVALRELLQNGWPQDALGGKPPDIPAPNWNALGDLWQLYANSEYGLGEYRLKLPAGQPRAKQFRVHLALHGLRWKLSGFDLPQEVLNRLARELMKQKP
jgi:hypothetical protein